MGAVFQGTDVHPWGGSERSAGFSDGHGVGRGQWLLSGVGPAVAKGRASWAPRHPRQEAALVRRPQVGSRRWKLALTVTGAWKRVLLPAQKHGCLCTAESALNTAGVPSGLHRLYF